MKRFQTRKSSDTIKSDSGWREWGEWVGRTKMGVSRNKKVHCFLQDHLALDPLTNNDDDFAAAREIQLTERWKYISCVMEIEAGMKSCIVSSDTNFPWTSSEMTVIRIQLEKYKLQSDRNTLNGVKEIHLMSNGNKRWNKKVHCFVRDHLAPDPSSAPLTFLFPLDSNPSIWSNYVEKYNLQSDRNTFNDVREIHLMMWEKYT